MYVLMTLQLIFNFRRSVVRGCFGLIRELFAGPTMHVSSAGDTQNEVAAPFGRLLRHSIPFKLQSEGVWV